ncbi:MAG: methyltransferase [Clostridia bacterium]|nr:methyltransferase [Clostridia bacterium]
MKNIAIADDERLDFVNEKITLIQKKDGLTFGTDAFLLASFIKPKRYGRAAELGAGTGIISLLLAARDKFSTVDAFEIQEDFASLSKRNAIANSLDGKVKVLCRDVRDLRSAEFGEYDVIFTNPPYMKTDSGKRNESDRKYIARHEVCGNIGDFCAAAFRLLKHGGKFYAVWRPDRLCDLICAMRDNRLEPKVMTLVSATEQSAPSMVLVSATKGGASGITLTPPLILYRDGTLDLSEKAQRIYDTLSFE